MKKFVWMEIFIIGTLEASGPIPLPPSNLPEHSPAASVTPLSSPISSPIPSVKPAPSKKRRAGISPEKAMSLLKKGHIRFLAGESKKMGQDESFRQRLKDKEKPHTLIIACTDSRVPPELIFDQRPGDISVIRVAGQVLDQSVIASAEHAVEKLGTRNIFILGHTGCDAVQAAVSGKTEGSEHWEGLVADIRARVKNDRRPASGKNPYLVRESAANAEGLAAEIPSRSAILKEAIEAEKIEIHWGLYHIDTGVVDFH